MDASHIKVIPPNRVDGIYPDRSGNVITKQVIDVAEFDYFVTTPEAATQGTVYYDTTGRQGIASIEEDGTPVFIVQTGSEATNIGINVPIASLPNNQSLLEFAISSHRDIADYLKSMPYTANTIYVPMVVNLQSLVAYETGLSALQVNTVPTLPASIEQYSLLLVDADSIYILAFYADATNATITQQQWAKASPQSTPITTVLFDQVNGINTAFTAPTAALVLYKTGTGWWQSVSYYISVATRSNIVPPEILQEDFTFNADGSGTITLQYQQITYLNLPVTLLYSLATSDTAGTLNSVGYALGANKNLTATIDFDAADMFLFLALNDNDANTGALIRRYDLAAERIKAAGGTGGGVTIEEVNDAITTHDTSESAHAFIQSAVASNANDITSLENDVEDINEVIPDAASSTNQLADKDFVNSSITATAARALTYDANGNPFPTKAALNSATVFYYKGVATTPTDNDYVVVLSDETQASAQVRYGYETPTWVFRYKINDAPFTTAQNNAINSGATTAIIASIANKANKIVPAVAGNLAALSSHGELFDSGIYGKDLNGKIVYMVSMTRALAAVYVVGNTTDELWAYYNDTTNTWVRVDGLYSASDNRTQYVAAPGSASQFMLSTTNQASGGINPPVFARWYIADIEVVAGNNVTVTATNPMDAASLGLQRYTINADGAVTLTDNTTGITTNQLQMFGYDASTTIPDNLPSGSLIFVYE